MKTLRSVLAPWPPLLACPLMLVTTESNAFADVVTDWNCALTSYCAALGPDEVPAAVEARIFATVHLAMLDAVHTALDASVQSGTAPLARAQIAAAQAAHDVLVAVWPDGRSTFAARLADDLHEFDFAGERARGRAIGVEAARPRIIELGLAGAAPFRVNSFTSAADGVDAAWRALPPLALPRRDQFRAGHPATDDATFAILRFNRSKTVKPLFDARHAADWPRLAGFWRESSAQRWNRAARELTVGDAPDLLARAQLFAVLNVALADAGIAAEASRRYYRSSQSNLQFSAHMYQIDGGYPVLEKTGTAPVPNFPSTVAAECGAAAAVLIRFFGDDRRAFTLAATGLAPGDLSPPAPRTFQRVSDATLEGALAGLFAGRDFKEACTLGYDLGWRVGGWVAKRPEFTRRP